MQNNNNMGANGTYKEKGLRINSQVRCFKLVHGTKQDGSLWALITRIEKDTNKNVVQKYNLWLLNDYNFIANFPTDRIVDVRIDYIQSVKPEWNTYTSKETGKKITERIISMEVGVSIVSSMPNNYNNNNNNINNNYNNGNNGYQKPTQQQPQTSQLDEIDNNTFDITNDIMDDLPF